MSDNNVSPNLKLQLLGPVADSIAKTLQDCWDLTFGRFSLYVEKHRIRRAKELEDFKETLENKVNKIPPQRLCEPPLSIVGPIFEASKYYFEEKEIRDMFASIISASVDVETASIVHPSFSVIVQQLSRIDAQNLEHFYRRKHYPLCEYQIKFSSDKNKNLADISIPYITVHTNIFLTEPPTCTIEQGSISITTLERLGLISVTYDKILRNNDYQIFETTEMFQSLITNCAHKPDQHPYIQKGYASLTPLGMQLCSICFSDRVSDK